MYGRTSLSPALIAAEDHLGGPLTTRRIDEATVTLAPGAWDCTAATNASERLIT